VFPFLVNGQKVTMGHVFAHHYEHKVINVQCGMDCTVLSMKVQPKPGFLENLEKGDDLMVNVERVHLGEQQQNSVGQNDDDETPMKFN